MADLANPKESGPLPTRGSPTGSLKSRFLGMLHEAPPEGIRFRVECAWCGAVITAGDPGALVSHGACLPCGERLLDELKQREISLSSTLWDIARYASETFQPIPWAPILLLIPTAVLL